jgi:antitoxin VapB
MAPISEDGTKNRLQLAQSAGDSHLNVVEGKSRHDRTMGDEIPPQKHGSWDAFFAALADADVPADFLDERERDQEVHYRDPFSGWRE